MITRSACAPTPVDEKLVRSVIPAGGCQHSCVLPAGGGQDALVLTLPDRNDQTHSFFLHGGGYTRETRYHIPERHWLLVTATITRVVSYSVVATWPIKKKHKNANVQKKCKHVKHMNKNINKK